MNVALQPSLAPLPHFLTAGIYDYALEELTPALRSLYHSIARSWFHSLEFSTLFAEPAADRVWMRLDDNGALGEACSYRSKMQRGRLKSLRVFASGQLSYAGLSTLMGQQQAAVATLTRLPHADYEPFSASLPDHLEIVRHQEASYTLTLPSNADDYLRGLGHKTRKHLPYYSRRLTREWGDKIEIIYRTDTQITATLFQQIADLNRARIESKGECYLWDEATQARWHALAQQHGLLIGLLYEGRLVAGIVATIDRHEAYLLLIGHDPQYDRLNLGNVCLWRTIEHLIALKFTRCHFLWGDFPYKSQLGGVAQPLHELTFFSSALAAAGWKLSHRARGYVFQLRRSETFSKIGQQARSVSRRGHQRL